MKERYRACLTHAVTAWDRENAHRSGYNLYALAQYLEAVDDCMIDYERHGDIQRALCDNFNDRLLTVCQSALEDAREHSEEW